MIRIDADVLRACPRGRLVRGIEPDLLGTKSGNGFDYSGGTAAGVLVLMETQAIVQLGRLLVFHRHRTRTWIDSAWAVRPSACASETIVGASPASPRRVSR